MQVTGATLALKPRTDITRSPKQMYQKDMKTRTCEFLIHLCKLTVFVSEESGSNHLCIHKQNVTEIPFAGVHL